MSIYYTGQKQLVLTLVRDAKLRQRGLVRTGRLCEKKKCVSAFRGNDSASPARNDGREWPWLIESGKSILYWLPYPHPLAIVLTTVLTSVPATLAVVRYLSLCRKNLSLGLSYNQQYRTYETPTVYIYAPTTPSPPSSPEHT